MNISNKINKEIDKRISNKKQEEIKYYFKIGITLLIISAVTATLLAFVNALTKDKIAENELAVMKDAISKIFDGCDEISEVEGEYADPVVAVYRVYKNGEKKGYGIQVAPIGFKEAIGIIVGTDCDGNCLGVEITSLSDTPGVGTKVKESSFLNGFIGLNGSTVSDYDTISGATISSSAVKEGVKAALALDVFTTDVEELSTDVVDDGEGAVPEDTTSEAVGDESGENEPSESESGNAESPEVEAGEAGGDESASQSDDSAQESTGQLEVV